MLRCVVAAALAAVAAESATVLLSKARVYAEEGGRATYTVVLSEAPTADVTVAMTIGDASLLKFLCSTSRTRREQSIHPKVGRIDFDVTELESSEVGAPTSQLTG